MLRCWICSFVVFVFVFIGPAADSASVSSSEEDDQSATKLFTDQWAVHISGGDKVADEIAARHGFTNLGKVKIAWAYV